MSSPWWLMASCEFIAFDTAVIDWLLRPVEPSYIDLLCIFVLAAVSGVVLGFLVGCFRR